MTFRVANAPCSWGVLEFGLQIETGFKQVLDEIRETGFDGTELGDWGFFPTGPESLDKELKGRGLHLVGAFVPLDLSDRSAHDPGEREALKIARLLSLVDREAMVILADDNGKDPVRTLNAGRIRIDQGLSEDRWQCFFEGLERIAGAVKRETGLRTAFHHHCGGYVETEAEIAKLLGGTDPELLGLCLDTGHWTFGGGDPVAALKAWGDRVWHVHFKDCDPDVSRKSRLNEWDYFESVRNGVFCELGKGEVDFRSLLSILRDMRYKGWIVVEQDVLPGMGSPRDSAARNRSYLKGLGL